MDARKLAASEAALKTRLANKFCLEAEARSLDAAGVSARCGMDVDVAQKLLDNDVEELTLFSIIASLAAIGLNVQFSTGNAAGDVGQILYDLDDAQ